MKRAILLFSFLFTSMGVSAAMVGCGDDTGSGGGDTTTTGTTSPTTTGNPTTGTMSTTSTMNTTGMSSSSTGMGTTAAGMFDCSAPDGSMPSLTLTEVADSLDNPVLVKAAPDNADRLYIVEQSGQVKIWENGDVLPTPFIDVSGIINAGGEQGLLGLAFPNDYATSGRFFLHYTADGSNDMTVGEFHRSADPLVADPAQVQLVVQHPTAEPNHNGGSIEFGSDGFLYVFWGDGGGGGDPQCDAQNPDNLWGKALRIDINGTPSATGYPAAAGNPDGSLIYHNGLRNPYRASFDACTGDLYIGDVGQGQWEEVDVVGDDMPHNFGWPTREGMHDFDNTCPNPPANPTEPVAEYDHGGGACSISGGYVYRSSAVPGLRGTYFYGDYCSGDIWMLRWENGAVVSGPTDSGLNGGNISGFGQDGKGNVYVLNHTQGTVSRIDAQ
ncbi:MAG: glucose dehydrogenase [Polyangiaceae bacterium]|nr:glucose dehydrogenase [Polyangiaceae bacterium]